MQMIENTDKAMVIANEYFELLGKWERDAAHLSGNWPNVAAQAHSDAHRRLIATPATSLEAVLAKLEAIWSDSDLQPFMSDEPDIESATLLSVKVDLRAMIARQAGTQGIC
jgi:hypothetical protein